MRIWHLNYRPLWWDEGISIYLAHQSIPAILADRAADVHPPLYFLLLRAWIALTGPSDVASRLLSVAFGVLSVPVLYILGRRLADVRVGRIAALLLALAPFHIAHSQEARMYTLVPLAALFSTYVLARLADDDNHVGRKGWPAYTAAILVGIYVHYYAAFVPLFHGVYLLLHRRFDRSLVWHWIRSLVGAAGLYLPWLVFIGPTFLRTAVGKARVEADTALSLPDLAGQFLLTITQDNAGSPPSGWQVAGALLFAGLALAGTIHWIHARRNHRYRADAWWPLLYLAVPVIAGYLVNLRLPFSGFPRLLSFAAPGYYLLCAAGLTLSRQSRHTQVAACALAVTLSLPPLLAYYTTAPDPAEDYRPLVREVALQARPDDVLVTDFPWQTGYFLSYLPAGQQFDFYTAPRKTWAAQPGQMEQDLDRLMATHRRSWYPAYQALGGTQGRNIEGYLTDHYYLALDQWFGVTRLLLYGTRPANADSIASPPLEIELGQQVRLRGYEVGARYIQPGDILPITIVWETTAAIPDHLKVFIHLLDTQGTILAQRDSEPAGGSRPTTTWNAGDAVTDRYGVLIPPGTPSGEARIVVGLYQADTGERLRIRARGQRVIENTIDYIILGTVQIQKTAGNKQ